MTPCTSSNPCNSISFNLLHIDLLCVGGMRMTNREKTFQPHKLKWTYIPSVYQKSAIFLSYDARIREHTITISSLSTTQFLFRYLSYTSKYNFIVYDTVWCTVCTVHIESLQTDTAFSLGSNIFSSCSLFFFFFSLVCFPDILISS